ncbi:MAG: aminotransferase class I/II-fold pyridoxal phosphate-dependent enzyme [Bryobacterales bacterium]|nr:aminotransferase class I/II-fold pyridoxal phosphate-dependent enzyme [Bryobacterales bacterium]
MATSRQDDHRPTIERAGLDRLEPSAHDREQSARAMLDLILRAYESLPRQAALRIAGHAQFQEFYEDLPREPRAWPQVLSRLEHEVLPYLGRPSHPRFFAFVPGPSNWWGVWADAIARAYNVFAGCWYEGAGASMIEAVTVDWLRRVTGYPDTACGAFMSGGSIANLTALAAARQWAFGEDAFDHGTVYFSDQTHSSVERALKLLGIRRNRIRRIASDSSFQLPPDAITDAIQRDREAGLRPFCVVANAGTTNTGAIDPLPAIAAIAEREHLWMHVDGAYGGAAAFSSRGRDLLKGMDLSHSLTLDPHKWLFQPFDCGCVLFRSEATAHAAFHMTPEYLQDTMSTGEVNFWDLSPELTRPFRALKLWMSIQIFGADAIGRAIDHGFSLAETAESALRALPDWQIVTPAHMAVVTFRYAPAGADEPLLREWNTRIGRTITESGFAVVLSTELRGQKVLRLCPINPRTEVTDILATVAELDRIARSIRERP